jgi:dTDP-4-amino-4,6-dideoxygalactose transaminase
LPSRNWFGRHLALLGGTTTYTDCLAAATNLVRPGSLVEGAYIERYEQAFARQVGVDHAISFIAGRVGLYAILRSLGIGEGDEVLLQVPTHMVVANAIRYTGAKPVFVDCERTSYNIDLEHAAQRVSPRTRVLLVQHTFGIPVDMDAATAFAEAHDLIVLEDCVHSLGATFKGRQTGSFGRAAFFSTEETKMISTSLGGMVVTDDADLAERIRSFRERECERPGRWLAAQYLIKLMCYQVLTGARIHRVARALYDLLGRYQPLPKPVTREEWTGGQPEGYLRTLTNGQARMGLRQLERLESNLARRRRTVEIYREQLADLGDDGVCPVPPNVEPSWCRYPVRVSDLERVERRLKPFAVPGLWFVSVLEESESPSFGGYVEGSCPNAEAMVGHVVNLPTHGRVRRDDAVRLARIVRDAVTSAD